MILDDPGKKRKDYSGFGLQICRYYAINYPFFEMDFHSHKEWEIMYVVHGRCKVTCVEGEQERDYDLREGEYILTGGSVWHKLYVERNMPCRVLNLEGRLEATEDISCLKWLEKEKDFLGFCMDRETVMSGTDDGSLHDIIHALIRELKEASDCMPDFLLGQFVLLLARQRALGKKNRSGNVYIRKAQEYLEEQFDQEITIAQAAAAVGISEGYLQRLYKKETGHTITDEILKLRVEKAKLLLENSTLPIIDIAVNVGFNSRQHFTAMFRQLTGSTPMEWRKRKGDMRVYEGFPT